MVLTAKCKSDVVMVTSDKLHVLYLLGCLARFLNCIQSKDASTVAGTFTYT